MRTGILQTNRARTLGLLQDSNMDGGPTVSQQDSNMDGGPTGSTSVAGSEESATGSTDSKGKEQPQPRRRQQQQQKKITVEGQSKIDAELSKHIDTSHLPSTGAVVIKWLATFIIGGLLLAAVTVSKLSIISLSKWMNSTQNNEIKNKVFVMLLVMLMIPNFVNLFRGFWGGAFRPDIPWPRRSAIIAGVVSSLLESCGICLFVFKVPDLKNPNHAILLMNCVFLIAIGYFLYLCFKINFTGSGTLRWRTLFVVAMLLELIGIACTLYLVRDLSVWLPSVAVLCLSIAWLPGLQSYLLEQDTGAAHTGDQTANDTGCESSSDTAYETLSNAGVLQDELGHNSIQMKFIPQKGRNERTTSERKITGKPTWKMTILMSIFKIVFTFSFSFVVFSEILEQDITTYREGWTWTDMSGEEVFYFIANVLSSFIGYILGYLACASCMQKYAFALPLFLATPLAVILLSVEESCSWVMINPDAGVCTFDTEPVWIAAVICLVLAQGCSTGWLLFSSQSIVMLKEEQLFWLPTYNPALLEQWLLLARRNKHNDADHMDPEESAKRSKVIICTTMYREADYEMKQLLESISRVNRAQSEGVRHFESHVFFDGAVKDRNPTEFVLQLVSLVESTLGVKPGDATKMITPYGMSLSWELNSQPGKKGMIFKIHLKDNFKVKNKKRWSQVMYMSYILDFILRNMDNATLEDTYILTTDADVRFTPDSVEALLDLMTRDHSVGAACARTHPLGSGPLVWYQVFEYAIGHWFQKAAEHVFGSVLCSPGCFSVYRCRAVLDILPMYASNVEHAFDFLTKDMGEDRWMCTLMVQSGWRIEYCAASENSTHCPEEFEEFYKQRRRWVASTLANLMLLMKEWHLIRRFNHRVSIVFLIYQAILLFATLIGPSSVILVVSGGLVFGMGISSVTTLVLQIIVCVGFTLICLFASSRIQLNAAKLLTFLYSMVMTAVLVGMSVQVATDFYVEDDGEDNNATATTPSTRTTVNPNFISSDIRVSTTSVYLFTMIGVFLVTGALHLGEFVCLLHGIWYLLCLPSGYLMLTIYSICNITDRSWGTREQKVHSVVAQKLGWPERFKQYFKSFFFCCFKKLPDMVTIGIQTDSAVPRHRHRIHSWTNVSTGETTPPPMGTTSQQYSQTHNQSNYQTAAADIHQSDGSVLVPIDEETSRPSLDLKHIQQSAEFTRTQEEEPEYNAEEDDEEEMDRDTIIAVRDWLPGDLKRYASNFTDNGFDNTMFIATMTEKELKDIAIKGKGARKYLMDHIKLLPGYEIQAEVPDTVDAWLEIIGLPMYKKAFRHNQIKTAKEMEILKSFGRKDIEQELKITKTGHVKRLMYAIRKLRNPTGEERNVMAVRKALDYIITNDLKTVNCDEYEFWTKLNQQCLMPASTAYGLDDDLKEKLGDLRNSWVMIFAVSNTLWLILITALANRGKLLTVFGANPLGLAVLVLFTGVLLLQFLAMIVHRVATLTHYLGRAPYSVRSSYNTVWTFDGTSPLQDIQSDDFQAMYAKQQAERKARLRLQPRQNRPNQHDDERTRLL